MEEKSYRRPQAASAPKAPSLLLHLVEEGAAHTYSVIVCFFFLLPLPLLYGWESWDLMQIRVLSSPYSGPDSGQDLFHTMPNYHITP